MTKTTINDIISIDLCRANIFNYLNYIDLFKIVLVKYLQKALNTVYLEDSIKAESPFKLKEFWILELDWAIECEREKERYIDDVEEYEDMVQSYKFDMFY